MSKSVKQDILYRNPQGRVSKFSFDANVAEVFPDMIRRSVPGYEEIITLIGLVAEKYTKPDTNLYDLGCSLGAATASMASRLDLSRMGCRILSVDNSAAMIHQCEETLRKNNNWSEIELICGDIEDIYIENASIVILNFTLQFIPLDRRRRLLEKIYDGMIPNGVLVLSEKINASHSKTNDELVDLHHCFKKANGYSELEISQKRDALEDVLLPETLSTHQERLADAGFSHSQVWYQCFNFASVLAWK